MQQQQYFGLEAVTISNTMAARSLVVRYGRCRYPYYSLDKRLVVWYRNDILVYAIILQQ